MKLSHGRLHLSVSRCSGAWGSESSSFVIQRMTFLGQSDEVVSCEKASGTRMGTPYHLISLGNQSLINKILANCYELYEVIATIKQKKRFTVKKN